MCLQVCWKGKFKASQFLCSYSICINKQQGDAIHFFLSSFGVKLRFSVWILAILKTMPETNSFMFVFIFVWTLKALTSSIVTVRFPSFPAPFHVSKRKNSFLLGRVDAGVQEAAALHLPPALSLALDHLQILPWLDSLNSLYFAKTLHCFAESNGKVIVRVF